jgi:transcriptional regulator with XRE-family HTH domain
MNFKKQLKLYLDKRGLSASDLSRISGVPKQSISDWLGGSSPRNILNVKKVADALLVSIDHLVFGDGFLERSEGVGALPVANEWVDGVYEVKFRKMNRNDPRGSGESD